MLFETTFRDQDVRLEVTEKGILRVFGATDFSINYHVTIHTPYGTGGVTYLENTYLVNARIKGIGEGAPEIEIVEVGIYHAGDFKEEDERSNEATLTDIAALDFMRDLFDSLAL